MTAKRYVNTVGGFEQVDECNEHYAPHLVLASDYDALLTKFNALIRGGVLEYTDPDDGDKVTVCPTCGQSHCGTSRAELRPKLIAAGLVSVEGDQRGD